MARRGRQAVRDKVDSRKSLRGPLPPGHENGCGPTTLTVKLEPGELVRRIQAGDRQAEDELVRRYARGISVIIARAGCDRGMIEDVCQDTLRITIERVRRGDVREPDRLSGFIASLARNLVIEHFRGIRKRDHRLLLESSGASSTESSGQLQRLLEEEQVQIVHRVLAEMSSERDRQILYRYYVAEEDKDRICADLGLTSLHFNRVLYRARERFRDLYLTATGRAG
jgi:RNA polymerase sigma-70 factor (ECF subfamily)